MISDTKRQARHAERSTKRFCQQALAARSTFLTHIQGISSQTEISGYATLMFNRLVAAYFLQHKRLLDDDTHYLSHHLKLVQEQKGEDCFYAYFLLPLFHEYLSQPVHPGVSAPLYGNVPALNLHLFSTCAVEHALPSIQIADEAFTQLFAFLDTYSWQLTSSTVPKTNVLGPDILDCLFEQQILQKQMGAYYTGKDVTAYIARNTIIPFIFAEMKALFPAEFVPQALLWRLLQNDPQQYIFPSLRYEGYLPTETEREHCIRRTRYADLYARLQAGELHTFDDLITSNLDILHFAQDIIMSCERDDLVWDFYIQLERISILDPTCGSGAFLLAALHILTPLYSACLERMQTMTDARCGALLERVAHHPNRQHFIITSILTHNLHGVDIMEEATDICKLRLFLVLLAHAEEKEHAKSLVALDSNIRCGNAVVGFSSVPLDERGKDMLNGIETSKMATHPFHWFVEFPSILQRGGFDVIIGNPPYVEYSKVRDIYQIYEYQTESCGNLYAAVIERSLALCRSGRSYLGLLVPLSICGGERFGQLRRMIVHNTSVRWLANFEIFPCRLFEGAFQRLSILLARHGTGSVHHAHNTHDVTYVTKIQRWYAAERPHLINLISYTLTNSFVKPDVFPRLAAPLQGGILQKMHMCARGSNIATVLSSRETSYFVYYQEATNYWTKAVCHIPFYRKNGIVMIPPHGRILYFKSEQIARTVMALMNSSLFYLWFATYADGFHLSHALVKEFPVGSDPFSLLQTLPLLSQRLEADIALHARMGTRNTRSVAGTNGKGHGIELAEYHMGNSKLLLDEIDGVLARYYGFTSEELSFVINYDSKYRLRQQHERTGKIKYAE